MKKKQGSQLATVFSSKKLLKKENIFFACGQTISHRVKDPVNQFMNSTINFFICRKMFIMQQRKTLRVEYSSLSPYMLYGSSENGRTTNSWLNVIKLWNKKQKFWVIKLSSSLFSLSFFKCFYTICNSRVSWQFSFIVGKDIC